MADDSRIIVPVTIGGTSAKMLVDTGGVTTTIFSDTATRLGLHVMAQMSNDEGMIDVHGQSSTELVTVPEFGLGDMKGRNLTFMWEPRGQHDAEFDGILSPDLLRRYDVDIDFGNRKLKLFSPEHCTGSVVYWTSAYDSIPASIGDGGHIEIPVVLDGREIRAIVDTGAFMTVLSNDHARQLFDLGENSPGVEKIPGSTSDSFIRYQYRFKQLSFGAVRVSNPAIAFLPDAAAHTARLAVERLAGDPALGPTIEDTTLLLGLDILRKLHLYIAYGEHRIYLTAADAGQADSPSDPAAAPTAK